ncbi:hypothetical protein JB92DRAFT_3015434 [Gautieria morchelliformis]|nr:hypothetical protein JB92DRAFT_3015434 [Gautieria morchelliformis]
MPPCFDRVVVLRSRGYVHVAVVVIGILWIGVLSAYAFTKGGYPTVQESVSVTLLLSFNALSTLCIPIFSLLDASDSVERSRWYSHVWFELTSLSLLLVSHFAAALLFDILSPSFHCANSNPDSEGWCKLINVYISVASWITPLILFLFISYLSLASFRTAPRFPTLWHTPVRFCPWDDADLHVSKIIRTKALDADPREIEEAAGGSVSQLSCSQPQSRGRSQTLVPPITHMNPPPRRTSQISRPLPHPPGGRVTVRPPQPGVRRTYLSPLRMVSQPPPSRSTFQPPSSRAMSHRPSSQTPSLPIPLHHDATLHPSRTGMILLPINTAVSARAGDSTSSFKRGNELERYCDSWNRNRRGSASHPTWRA